MVWFDELPARMDEEPFLVAVHAAIERWPAPAVAPSFMVGFSGGLDSTVLLAGLCRLGAGHRLRAVHVDHGLHAESSGWAERCAAVAAGLDVEFAGVRVDVAIDSGHGLEAAARDARYRALGALLKPGEVLLTAHHGDDQLETLLLRMLRGTGVRGLRGIIGFGSFGVGSLGRPLLGFTRAELEEQAAAWGLEWLDDPSNAESRHDRNFLRLHVLPPLRERWPAATRSAERLAEQMGDAESILDDMALADSAGLDELRRIPKAFLITRSAPRQRNLLRYLVRRAGLPTPSAQKLEELREALLGSRREAQPLVRWPGGEGRVFREQLYLQAPLVAPSPPSSGAAISRAGWSGPEGVVGFFPASGPDGLPESWLDDGLTLAFRAGGEAIRPLGRRHRQPLKRWLQQAGVVPWMRSRIPLLYRDNALVAVGDLWLAAEVRMADADEPRWCVRWTEHPPLF